MNSQPEKLRGKNRKQKQKQYPRTVERQQNV